MKIGSNLVGNTTAKFSTRVQKLILKIASTHADVAALKAAIKASKIEVVSTHPSYATKTRLYKNPLSHLMEIAACNEGSVRIDGAGGAFVVRGSIELSDDGAIVPLENEQFTVSLELAANLTVELSVLDADTDASTVNIYKPVPCFGATPTPLAVSMAKFLAVPKAQLEKLELEIAGTGRRIEFLPDEIEQMVSEQNELAIIENGVVTTGSDELFILNVAYYTKAYVTTTEQVNVYLLEYERA